MAFRVELSSLSLSQAQIDQPAADVEFSGAGAAPSSPPGVIIVGGAHGSVAVARSLGRQGIPVWFFGDGHPIAGYSRYVSRRFLWQRSEPESALNLLVDLAQHQGAKGWVLFPSGDPALQLVAQHQERLAEHFRLFTMPWSSLRTLNDKSCLYALAAQVGVPYPRSYDIEAGDLPAPDSFPVIIKPVSSEKINALTRVKAWRIETADELVRRYQDAVAMMGREHVVVQEMIPGGGERQFSYAGLWENGVELASLTARRTRQFPLDFGLTSSFVETMPVPDVAESARRLLKAVGFHGLLEVEFKYDERDGAYKVLDANTRAWAWIGLGAKAGIDFPYLAWCLATGRAVPRNLAVRRASWSHPTRNVLSLAAQLRRDGRLPLSALRTAIGASTLATFAFDDPMPGVLDFPIQLQRLFRRFRRPVVPVDQGPPLEPPLGDDDGVARLNREI